jgi:hypothetical protein
MPLGLSGWPSNWFSLIKTGAIMSKTIKSITNPKLRLEILTPLEIKKIHDATLWIIGKVGVRFPLNRALDIWAAHGAEVDFGYDEFSAFIDSRPKISSHCHQLPDKEHRPFDLEALFRNSYVN